MLIRRATDSDLRDLWEWRNDRLTREMSVNSEPVPFDVHSAWYARALRDPRRLIYIGELSTQKIGMARFDLCDNETEVSINLNPAARERRLAAPFLMASVVEFDRKEVPLLATIRKKNAASIRCFESCGFLKYREDDQFFFYRLMGA